MRTSDCRPHQSLAFMDVVCGSKSPSTFCPSRWMLSADRIFSSFSVPGKPSSGCIRPPRQHARVWACAARQEAFHSEQQELALNATQSEPDMPRTMQKDIAIVAHTSASAEVAPSDDAKKPEEPPARRSRKRRCIAESSSPDPVDNQWSCKICGDPANTGPPGCQRRLGTRCGFCAAYVSRCPASSMEEVAMKSGEARQRMRIHFEKSTAAATARLGPELWKAMSTQELWGAGHHYDAPGPHSLRTAGCG